MMIDEEKNEGNATLHLPFTLVFPILPVTPFHLGIIGRT